MVQTTLTPFGLSLIHRLSPQRLRKTSTCLTPALPLPDPLHPSSRLRSHFRFAMGIGGAANYRTRTPTSSQPEYWSTKGALSSATPGKVSGMAVLATIPTQLRRHQLATLHMIRKIYQHVELRDFTSESEVLEIAQESHPWVIEGKTDKSAREQPRAFAADVGGLENYVHLKLRTGRSRCWSDKLRRDTI